MADCSQDFCAASASEPVGTTSADALACNASTLDTLVNQQGGFVVNRVGDSLPTLYEQLSRLGFEPPVAYAAGVTFASGEITKTISRPDDSNPTSSIIYAGHPDQFPFTTSGTWAGDDELKFFVVQGAEESQIKSVTAQLTDLVFSDVENMVAGTTAAGGPVNFAKLAEDQAMVKTTAFYGGWSASVNPPRGGAPYIILTAAAYGATPDGYVDHYVGGGADYVAKLLHAGVIDVQQAGAAGDWFDYDSGTVNPSPTDDTVAIQAVYNYMTRGDNITGFGWGVYYPTGYYAISSELQSPSVTRSFGDGRYNSHIIALTGFTGVMLGDKGSASKLYVHDLEVDTRDEAGVTDAIKMGYTVPFGTEGGIYEVLLTGGATNAVNNTDALNVVGNVGLFHHISAIRFKRGITEGPNSTANHFDNIVTLGCKERSYSLNTGSKLTNWHLEAPILGSVPIFVGNTAMICQGTVSLGDDSIPDIIVMAAGSVGIAVSGVLVLTAGAGTFTNILNDQRPSSEQQYWANSSQKGRVYTFNDVVSIPVGTTASITEAAGGNIQYNNQSSGGGHLLGSKRAGVVEYFISNASVGFDGPSVDNARNLARASQRYTDAFFVNAPTVTSDVRTKKDIQSIPQELLDFVLSVEIKQYRLIENNSERFHYGVIITPEFIGALNAVYSVDQCAALCHELFTDENCEPVDLIVGGVLLGDIWQVRYGEWQNILLEAMRRKMVS